MEFLDTDALRRADDGSWYTIIGAGGDLAEWTAGYEAWLAEQNIGKPVAWFTTNGGAVNAYAGQPADPYPSDLTFLLFPLDGLDIGRLAMFKVARGDRWFDDVIANHR